MFGIKGFHIHSSINMHFYLVYYTDKVRERGGGRGRELIINLKYLLCALNPRREAGGYNRQKYYRKLKILSCALLMPRNPII